MIDLGGNYYTEKDLKDNGFMSLGKNVLIHSRASIYGAKNISIGNNVRIDDFVVIIATGPLKIGNYVSIPNFCFLGSKYEIELNDFVTLAPGVKVFSCSDDYSGESLTGPLVPPSLVNGKTGKVVLEKHVLIGAGSVILPNVHISEGVSVGALSLVKENLAPWGIYAGVPTFRIKDRKKNLIKLQNKIKEEAYQ